MSLRQATVCASFEVHFPLAAATSTSDNVLGNDQCMTNTSAAAGAVTTGYNAHLVLGLAVESPVCRPGLVRQFGCKVRNNHRRT